MRTASMLGPVVAATVLTLTAVGVAHQKGHAAALPAGPIRDRHMLMEGIGDDAKAIGDAMKRSDNKTVAAAAQKIQTASQKIVGLFPEGSTHPKSRAKAEIWKNFPQFTTDAQQLENTAGALVAAANGGGDVKAASQAMFGACKSCHDAFRVPEKGK